MLGIKHPAECVSVRNNLVVERGCPQVGFSADAEKKWGI